MKRAAPLTVEHAHGVIIERFEDGSERLTCDQCGLRTANPRDLEMGCCPRCGPVDDDAHLAKDLIGGLWL